MREIHTNLDQLATLDIGVAARLAGFLIPAGADVAVCRHVATIPFPPPSRKTLLSDFSPVAGIGRFSPLSSQAITALVEVVRRVPFPGERAQDVVEEERLVLLQPLARWWRTRHFTEQKFRFLSRRARNVPPQVQQGIMFLIALRRSNAILPCPTGKAVVGCGASPV